MAQERKHKINYPCKLVQHWVHSTFTIVQQDNGRRELKEITCDGLYRCGLKHSPSVPEGIDWSQCPLYGDLAKLLPKPMV